MELLTINDRGVSRELRMYIPGWLARTESQCGSPKGPVAAAACKPSLFSLETHPTLPISHRYSVVLIYNLIPRTLIEKYLIPGQKEHNSFQEFSITINLNLQNPLTQEHTFSPQLSIN